MILNGNTPEFGALCSRRRFLRLAALGAAGAVACAVAPVALAFKSPLEAPATNSNLNLSSPLLGVAFTGKRIVVVGLRGCILLSDDEGKNWLPAQVPVSTDLVSVCFPVPDKGWAVGHGGVVLHSADGGTTWSKQLDGTQASQQAIAYYQARSNTLANAQECLERERSLAQDGETQPFMDVFFADENHGYVVGTFNRIFRTEDGGKTWVPMMDRVDNTAELHFYGVKGRAGQLYLTGEQGKVWRLDDSSERFAQLDTPYNGTFFGLLLPGENTLLAYGMRGSLYRSADRGSSWEKVNSSAQGGITSAVTLPGGRILIADQLGGIAQSSDEGRHFDALKMVNKMPYFGASVISDHKVALVGALGVHIEAV
jgi:photosystem II stability/assembly factor-like uncharacterized protein